MKKILFFFSTIFVLVSCSAQYVINGRLQIKSGTGLNSIIGGSDTIYYGWDAHKFSFFDKDTTKILEFGLSDTAKFYSNLKFSSAYTDGTIYWPGSDNSYIKGNALYFLHGSEFLQAIPTQLKISASTHDYTTLNSYRLQLNKAASEFIQLDTNGVLMYGTDYAVRDEQGFEYLRHNYGDSSTTIGNTTISNAAADTAVVINGNLKADTIFGYLQKPYKSYIALLTQVDANAPTATVIENTLGGNPVCERYKSGAYSITLNGAFVVGKTVVFINQSRYNGFSIVNVTHVDSDMIIIDTYNVAGAAPSDGMLYNTSIEIRVYP